MNPYTALKGDVLPCIYMPLVSIDTVATVGLKPVRCKMNDRQGMDISNNLGAHFKWLFQWKKNRSIRVN